MPARGEERQRSVGQRTDASPGGPRQQAFQSPGALTRSHGPQQAGEQAPQVDGWEALALVYAVHIMHPKSLGGYCDVAFAAAAWRVQRATTYLLGPPAGAEAGGSPKWTVYDATPPEHVVAASRPVHENDCTLGPISLVRLGSHSGAHTRVTGSPSYLRSAPLASRPRRACRRP